MINELRNINLINYLGYLIRVVFLHDENIKLKQLMNFFLKWGDI